MLDMRWAHSSHVKQNGRDLREEIKHTTGNDLTSSIAIDNLSLPELASFVAGADPPKPQTTLPGANIPPTLEDVLSAIGQPPLAGAIVIATSGTGVLENAFQLQSQAFKELLKKP